LYKAPILPYFYTKENPERREDFRRMGSIKEGFTTKGSGNGKSTSLEKLNLSSQLIGYVSM